MNEEKTLTVTTLSGAIYEFRDVGQGRATIIRDLATMDEELFPLHRTDVVEIGPSTWMAMVLADAGVTYVGHPMEAHTRLFRTDSSCFTPSIVESPTRVDLQSTSLGTPYSIKLMTFEHKGETHYSIEHNFTHGRYLIQQMWRRVDRAQKSSLSEQLERCCYAIHADGSCQRLTTNAIAAILRLYDVFRS